MKNRICKIVLLIVAVLILPVSFLIGGFCTPSKYEETYYGELSCMVDRLKNSEKKKIIIIGNSAVAFGVDSALVEEELKLDGLDYDVCNFGLYGSIGTKAMLDLAENYINEGDIIVFSPEFNEQSLSLYFSAKEMWYAVDSDFSLLKNIKEKDMMVGAFPKYVADKLKTDKVQGNGVYAKKSFDDHADMKNADRAYNIMVDGYDTNNLFSFEKKLPSDFIAYVNLFYENVRKKGASMVYSFAPVNKKALPENQETVIDEFYDELSFLFDFPILGNPHDCVMDYEWFYDSNVHLNTSGMRARTISLVNDLKLYFEKSSPVRAEMPSKPSIPQQEEPTDDPLLEKYFRFEATDNGKLIVGLTDEGKNQKTLTLPSSVYGFTVETFQNNALIEEITLPASIRVLYNESFLGCTSLKKLCILQENPEKVSVGYSLLKGTTSCKIYVTKKAFPAYSSNYFWGHYAGDLEIL